MLFECMHIIYQVKFNLTFKNVILKSKIDSQKFNKKIRIFFD